MAKEKRLGSLRLVFAVPIITIVASIVFPHYYFQTHTTVDTISVITAIYTAMGVETAILGTLLGIVITRQR